MNLERKFVFAPAIVYLLSNVFAAVAASQLELNGISWADPFNITSSILDDSILQIDLSTASSNPDSFAAVGPGINASRSTLEKWVGSGFHKKGNISEFLLGDWEISGDLSIDEGLTAKIDVAIYFEHDRGVEATNLKRVLDVAGPRRGPFSVRLNATQAAKSYCSGLEANRTFVQGYWDAHLLFQIDRAPNATSNAKGSIGERNDKALSLRTRLAVKEGCSRTDMTCRKDRTGFELCYQS